MRPWLAAMMLTATSRLAPPALGLRPSSFAVLRKTLVRRAPATGRGFDCAEASSSFSSRAGARRGATRMGTAPAEAEGTSGGKKGRGKVDDSPYKGTVILPQTAFDQRANAVAREPQLQAFWDAERVYERLAEGNPGEKYVLHDGPPYANGDLHIGHALNKVLKDFINRYQLLRGRKARYVPGWDCHGLPIELKVLQTIKASERQGLTPLQLRKRAAVFAAEAVARQAASFRRYGVWGHWDRPYLTMQPEYEARQIEVFGKMVKEGHIYRGRKPVNWSPSSRTALAEAELEYPEGHVSTSLYAAFRVTAASPALQPFFSRESGGSDGKELAVAVWTTTPWTIPANLAVAVNERLEYCVVEHPGLGPRRLVVARDLVGTLAGKLGIPDGEALTVLATFTGGELAAGTSYEHPLYADRHSDVVLGGEYITTETGTGLVHTAPGHGQEDYLTGQKYGLPLLSPVDDAGRFTAEAGERFTGLSVLNEGNLEVLKAMEEAGALLKSEPYGHKYPYDWRTKQPTIFRATDQWFASVDRFRDAAAAAIEGVRWIPEVGKNRIGAMVAGRSDWCISRQRAWGVPIPVFYHKDTGEPLLTPESIEHVRSVVADKGTDAWWELDTAALLPPVLRGEADQWVRGQDTMDVWFDSGSSWAGVAAGREELSWPVDLYLEGSDQHRGWFQSSLLTSVAAEGRAPYRTVLTHGFVLDERGYKMSKSLGNTIDPKEVIEGGSNKKLKPAYGADVLRLWVSTVDYTSDVCVGDNILRQVADSYRKLRNTLRYLTGNLFDYDPAPAASGGNAVPYEELPSLDKWILGRLGDLTDEVTEAFESYQFARASAALQRFAVADLSNFYLDVAKDRLYISAPDDARRRACQTTLYALLLGLTRAMAPILPHMAEDVWQTLPFAPPAGARSVFEAGWVGERRPPHEVEKWDALRALRNDVNKALELARGSKAMGASLEAELTVFAPDAATAALLAGMKGDDRLARESATTNSVDDLRFLLMVSAVRLAGSAAEVAAVAAETAAVAGTDSAEGAVAAEHEEQQRPQRLGFASLEGTESGCAVAVRRSAAAKCGRCWYHCNGVGSDPRHPTLCARCASIVVEAGVPPPPPARAGPAAAAAAGAPAAVVGG